MTNRAVVDTSSLVPARFRRDLQQAAQLRAFTAIWSPWIIAELNRVLTWQWIKRVHRGDTEADLSAANERRCAEAAKTMMQLLLPAFDVVTLLPPFPLAWDTLTDVWDHPIWAAAKLSGAQYVVSENSRHYPPRGNDGRHVYEGIKYLGAEDFLALLNGDVTAAGN